MTYLLWIVCVAVAVEILPERCVATPSPIVIIPGVGGSQLMVNDTATGRQCNTDYKFENLWVSSRLFFPLKCAQKELPLKYDPVDGSFHDQTNIEISVPGFGNTSSIEFLAPNYHKIPLTKYFNKMVRYFVNRGYKRGKSICGAPYDWRLAPDELEKRGYYHQLKSLIEEMYDSNHETKVTLVVHSMGGPISLHFLTGFDGIDQVWKDKYIHVYITLSAAWSGGVASLETVLSGTHGIPHLIPLRAWIGNTIANITRTFESILWLLPKPSVFNKTTVLVETPSRYYTVNDYQELFSKIGYVNGYKIFEDVQKINRNYPAPNVPTYCWYGGNMPTPERLLYDKDLDDLGKASMFDLNPEVVTGLNGDGTVDKVSSEVCLKWSDDTMQRHHFKYKAFDKMGHMDIVKHPKILKKIARIVGASADMANLKAKISCVKTFGWKNFLNCVRSRVRLT